MNWRRVGCCWTAELGGGIFNVSVRPPLDLRFKASPGKWNVHVNGMVVIENEPTPASAIQKAEQYLEEKIMECGLELASGRPGVKA